VAKYQPVKLAAMEAQWETQKNAPLHLLLFPDRVNKMNSLEWLSIPGAMSWMAYGDVNAEVKGLKAFPEKDWPPVGITFWSFRFMVALGALFILLAGIALLQWNTKEFSPRIADTLAWAIPLPYLGLALGWTVAEVGRQPWIVYGLMRTADAVSPVPPGNVVVSLAAFIAVYSLLGCIAVYLMRKYARQGPRS
jgi:cytochrome d ubiquinol oxidase subunit I